MLTRLFPALDTFRRYDRSLLGGDLNAGLTVGVMLIPQGMAYALIAGMPPVYGLYTALVPLLVYAFMGTSAQLAVGPVAMVSLLVATGIGEIAPSSPEEYVRLAILLALLVGVFQLVLGLVRFGSLTAFLSHPVLSGFTSAAALIIGLGQFKYVTGTTIPRGGFAETLMSTAASLPNAHLPTVMLGIGGVVALLLLKRLPRRVPGALIVVATGTLISWSFGLADQGVAIIGIVPAGLPVPSGGLPMAADVTRLLPTALAIGLIGYMESIAVAKSLARRHGTRIDPSQELVAQGVANILGSIFQAYPAAGGFGRSAVNDQSGAKTTLASLISAAVVGLTLLFLTPLFVHLPMALLASIVLVAVAGLVDWREARTLWRIRRADFTLLVVTFVATLWLGIEEGILMGVVLSLLMLVQQASRPHVARLGRLPGTTTYKNLERWKTASEPSGIAILRMDASLFFANVDFLRDCIDDLLDERPDAHALVLDMYPVNRIDASAVHGLESMKKDLALRGVTMFFSGMKGPVLDVLQRAGFMESLGAERSCMEIHDAVLAATDYLARNNE